MQKVKVCGKIASGFLINSLSSSIFHYFGGYFRMRNLSYFRRLFSRYSYRSPGRPSFNTIEWFRKAELALFFKNALIYLGLNFTLKIPVSEITYPWIRANSKIDSDFHHFTTCSSSQHGFADPFPFGVLICFLKGERTKKICQQRTKLKIWQN